MILVKVIEIFKNVFMTAVNVVEISKGVFFLNSSN